MGHGEECSLGVLFAVTQMRLLERGQEMMIKMQKMHSSVFDPENARKRINGEGSLGKGDRGDFVVTTTMFQGELPGYVKVSGSLELGMSQAVLAYLLQNWGNGARPATFVGELEVNGVPVIGTLRVDFKTKIGELDYSLAKKKARAA